MGKYGVCSLTASSSIGCGNTYLMSSATNKAQQYGSTEMLINNVCVIYFSDVSKTYSKAKFSYEVKAMDSASITSVLYLFDQSNQTFTKI